MRFVLIKKNIIVLTLSFITITLSSISSAAITISKSREVVNLDRVVYNWNSNDNEVLNYINRSDEHIFKFAQIAYDNGKPYREYIIKKARENNLPDEIFALAGVESSYLIDARSKAGAIGMWQFMTPTAREFGLIKRNSDNRKDWMKSTDAAMAYLSHLRDEHFYGDLELSVLAYNAGLGKVKRAIEKHQTTNVWDLVKDEKIFRKESIEYLPKFISYFNFYQMIDESESISGVFNNLVSK